MSWQDKIKNNIRITTGDGKVYEPLSLVDSNTKSFEFNISEFHFPGVAGTKVDRRLHKGTRYPLDFFFQGDDNIDQSNAFELSAKDLRPWTVLHPIFGQFVCHPISIEFDNSGINTTNIKVEVVETIIEDGPRTSFEAKDTAITSVKTATDSVNNYTASISPQVTDVTLMQGNIDNLYNEASSKIPDEPTANKYFNLYNTATTKINNALNEFNTGVIFITDFIVYPAQFAIGVKARLQILKDQALQLSAILDNLNSPNEKKIFESQKAAVVCSAIESTLTPIEGDYLSAVDVLFVISEIIDLYNDFIYELNQLQTPDGTQEDSYLPDPDLMYNLSYSIDYAVSNLLQIALSAQQERIIYLDTDSNPIILTHRFYGLDQQDQNVQRFIDTNQITMRELIQIPKGRKIVYYV
jgi:hypothetical protein